MILLNEIHLLRKRTFWVKFPFYDVSLFKVDINKYEISNVVTRKIFSDARIKHTPDSNFLTNDMPRFSDFKDCLVSSAFLPFSNFDSVRKRLLALAETITSPHGRSKPLYLALDTNLVYFKFFSRYFPLDAKEGERQVTAVDFRISISDLVREEIDLRIKHKYRASNLKRMKEAFAHPRIVDEFINCSMRKTRMAKSAQNEIKLLFAQLEAERAESESFSEDKEERDRLIAKSYSNFEKERNAEILLLSADEDMAYHAKNAGLLVETLIIPHKVGSLDKIEPRKLVNLIYDIALTFGAVSLQGVGITVLGEWKGKGFDAYSNEHLKLLIQEDSVILDELERDLRIADAIDQLN
jgi:hypothetical protein